jgi:hypothetical protein
VPCIGIDVGPCLVDAPKNVAGPWLARGPITAVGPYLVRQWLFVPCLHVGQPLLGGPSFVIYP